MKVLVIALLLVSCGDKVKYVGSVPTEEPCYTETVAGKNYVVCNDTKFEVANGTNGTNGADGKDGKDGKEGSFDGYLDLVELCPEVTGNYIETLFYLDGQYLAFLANSDYKKQRLTILKENTLFETTDGRKIKFTIINGEITFTNNTCTTYKPE